LLASTLEPSSAGSRRKVADLSATKLQRKGRTPSKFLDARFSQWIRIPSKRSGKQRQYRILVFHILLLLYFSF
jgi:hypothetical protein